MTPPLAFTKTFSASSGSASVVQIGVPRRGRINHLLVTQLDGALEGFSYTIYRSDAAFNEDWSLAAQSEIYRCAPVMTVSAPNASSADDDAFGLNYGYINDYNADGLPTSFYHYIYLRITPAGTGTKSFGISLTVINSSDNP